MTATTPRPHFRDLTAKECEELLAAHNVGRLAVSHRDRVDIFPIHYVFRDGWVYGRTAAGTKLEIVAHNRWVAFEVDEIEGLFDWRSVVIKGGLYLLSKEGGDHEVELYDRALNIVRQIVPDTMRRTDPLPERAIIFRIHVDEMTGRAASTSS